MYKKSIIAVLLIVCMLNGLAIAQNETGSVRGKVINSETGDPLTKAIVKIDGADSTSTTDLDGVYSLDGVPEGNHRITVSRSGYADSVVTDVEVKGNEVTLLDIALSPKAIQLGSVEVSAQRSRSTVAGILSSQRKAPTIGSSISFEQISKSPDSDASDVLKRVTGLSVVGDRFVFVRGLSERYSIARLNNSTLSSPEPDKWVVPFDIFPAGILDKITVSKTFVPDMPGNFAGGSIQMTTKDFPEKFNAKLGASFGYESGTTFKDVNTYEGGSLDFLGYDDGTRALPDIIAKASEDQLVVEGGMFGGGFTPQELEKFGESFKNLWTPKTEKAFLNQGYNFSIGDQVSMGGRPLGYVASLLYKNGHSVREENQSYYIRGAGGELEKRHDYQDVVSSKASTASGAIFNASWKPSVGQTIALRTTFSHTSDDEVYTYNIFPNRDRGMDQKYTMLRWVQRSLLSTQLSGERQLPFRESLLDWRASYSRSTRHEPDTRDTLYESEIGQDNFRFADETNSGNRFFSDLLDNSFDLGLDVTAPFKQWNSLPSKVKLGGSFVIKNREIDSRRFRFKPKDNNDVNLHQEPEELFKPENISPERFQLEEDTRATDNYSADQTIDAGYVMVDMPLSNKLRLVGGARVEFSEQEVKTFELFNPTFEPVIGLIKETDVMPSINLSYSLTDDMNLRAGVSQTVSRPSFRELSEFEFTDIGGHAIIGNPELKRALIQNYDLRWEWYTGITEYITLAVFYKHFNNPIEKTVKITSAELTSSWENAKSAYSYRTEVELRKNFGFISSALAPFSITGNMALVKSRVELHSVGSETLKERPLQGQSPFVVNLMASYSVIKTGTTISTLYNVFGERITEVGVFGTPDIYEEPFHKLDVVINQPIGGISLKFTANNLLDPDAKYTQGEKIQRIYKDGRSYSLGLSYSW